MVLEEEYDSRFTDMQKLITNTWKGMIKIRNSHTSLLGCK